MQRNRELAIAGAELLVERCGLQMICPRELLGPMVAFALPPDPRPADLDYTTSPNPTLILHTVLREEYGIQVPVFHFPQSPARILRISGKLTTAWPTTSDSPMRWESCCKPTRSIEQLTANSQDNGVFSRVVSPRMAEDSRTGS